MTLTLASLWILCQLVVEIGYADRLDQATTEFGHSVAYFVENPMLRIAPRMLPVFRDAMPGYEGNEVFSFLSQQSTQGEGPSPQEILDEKVWKAFGLLDSHPQRTLGVVPALAKPYTFASHILIHAGWFHLLGSLALLLMAGPLLERTFGRGAFVGMCLAVGIGSAALYAYLSPGSDRPLVGGTAIAIGLVSGILVRFKGESVDFTEWLAPWFDVEMRAPAWCAAAPAVAFIAAIPMLSGNHLPESVSVGPGYLSYAAASLLGAGIAFAYMKNGLERKFGNTLKVQPAAQPRAPRRFDSKRVEHARESGDLATAHSLIGAEALRSSGNRDVVLAYWDLSLEVGRAAEAVPVVFQLIREELRRGAVEIAASHWCRVVEVIPDAQLEPTVLAGLLPWIRKQGGADRTVLALEHVMQGCNENKPLPAPVLAEIAHQAAEIAPDIAEQAAQLALAGSGLSEERRVELEGLRARRAPKPEERPSVQVPPGELPVNVFYAEQDRSEFDSGAGDLGGLLPEELGIVHPEPVSHPELSVGGTFSTVRVALAVPRALEPEALVIRVAGRGEARLAYSRICGVTIAGVGGLAPKPIVVVDLMLSVADPDDLPLEVVRFRGDQFDPRRLVPGASEPLPALRSFVGELLKRSGGAAVPSLAILDPNARILMFETEDDYQRDVLGVRS